MLKPAGSLITLLFLAAGFSQAQPPAQTLTSEQRDYLQSLDKQIADAESHLAEMHRIYRPGYPGFQKAADVVESLRSRREFLAAHTAAIPDPLTDVNSQIADAERDLVRLREKYRPNYPGLRTAELRLQELTARREALLKPQ